jgi:hypothetical protein
MKLSSLIHFATVAIPCVTADSMGFSIRAPVEVADEMQVKSKHESDELFVDANWPEDKGDTEFCMDEAGTITAFISHGECEDRPLHKLVAVFPHLIEGKNLVDISTPEYTISVGDHL